METWLILVAICILFVCLIATVTVLIVYSGVFDRIQVGAGKPPIGKITIAYKFARGSYKELGPVFFEVATIAPDNGALGIYYDDPTKVEAHRQRYAVGCILAEDGQATNQDLVKKFESEGFKITELPSVEFAVSSSFPYKSAFSIFIGMQRVYSLVAEYVNEHGLKAHPFIEIYSGNTIQYMAPLEKHRQFYVTESLKDFPGEEPYESPFDETTDDADTDADSQHPVSDADRPVEQSLLHPSQIVRGSEIETVGKVEETLEKTDIKDSETVEKMAVETKREDLAAESESTSLTDVAQRERGSDEESGSSFEDLKMEAEEVADKPSPQ